jgi:hypothetical protein
MGRFQKMGYPFIAIARWMVYDGKSYRTMDDLGLPSWRKPPYRYRSYPLPYWNTHLIAAFNGPWTPSLRKTLSWKVGN